MTREHQHRETKQRGQRRDQHRGARGGDARRLAAPLIQFARHEEQAVVLADADDEDDEDAVHHVNRQSEPAHQAEGPQQAERQRQHHGEEQFHRAQ